MSKSSSEDRRGFFNEIFVFDKCEILNDKAVQCEISCFAGCEIFARKRANVIFTQNCLRKGKIGSGKFRKTIFTVAVVFGILLSADKKKRQ
jgi:hypothetical protein